MPSLGKKLGGGAVKRTERRAIKALCQALQRRPVQVSSWGQGGITRGLSFVLSLYLGREKCHKNAQLPTTSQCLIHTTWPPILISNTDSVYVYF